MSNDLNLKTSGTEPQKSKATIIVSALIALLVIGGAAFYFSQAKGTQGLIKLNESSVGTRLAVSSDTTGLDSSAKMGMKLAKVKFTAALNSTDPSENKATLQKFRVTVATSNMSADNYLLFPDDAGDSKYLEMNYVVKGVKVTNSVVEFDLTSNSTLVSSLYDDIIEGKSRTYAIRADVVTGTNGSLDLQLAKLGADASAQYGVNSDAQWTDGKNISARINGASSSLLIRHFTQASSSGTPASNQDPTVLGTQLTLAAEVDSPQGSSSGTTGKMIAKFKASVALNSTDATENSATLNNLDITFTGSNVNLTNVTLYPAAQDLNNIYAIKPVSLSNSAGRFAVSGNANWVKGGYNKVIEGTTQRYVVRADVSNGTNASLQVKFANLGSSSTTSLGTGNNGGDVEWTDGITQFFWVKQATTEVPLNIPALTFQSASGSYDATKPTLVSK